MISTTNTTTVTVPAAGSNVAIPFPQRFDEEEHLVVYRVTTAGARSTLTEGTHYSVTGTGNEGGGTVTVNTVTAGDSIIIAREVDITQQQDYVTNDRFPAAGTESQLDKQIMIDQQLNEALNRTIKVLPGEPDPVVSSRADRQETIPVWDNNGDYTEDTPSQLLSRLPIPDGTVSGVGMKTWPDDAARESSTYAPDFVGQIGTQVDTLLQYVGTGVTAGDWQLSTLWPSPITTEAQAIAAITAIGTADGGLTMTGSFALTDDLTIPENISTHWIQPGVMIDPAGFTLVINGSVNAPPNQQIFDISHGSYSPGDIYGQFGGSERHVGWWGAKADFDGGVTSGVNNSNFNSSGAASVNFSTTTITPPASGRDVTFTIPANRTAAPGALDTATDIFTVANHGFTDGDMVKFLKSTASGSSTLPSGATASLGESLTKVHPFEINVLSANTFKVKKDSTVIDFDADGSHSATIIPAAQTYDTIDATGFTAGHVIVVSSARDDVDITLEHGTGNLSLTGSSDVVLDSVNTLCTLKWSGTAWEQVAITEASISPNSYTDSTAAIQSAVNSGKNGPAASGSPSGTGVVRLGAGRYVISAQIDIRQTSCILAGLGYYSSTVYIDDRDATNFPDDYAFILGNLGGSWGDYMTGIQDITVRFRSLPQATTGMVLAKDDIGEPTWIKRVNASHSGREFVRVPVEAQCMNLVVEDCHFGSIKHSAESNVYIGESTYTATIQRNTFNSQQDLAKGTLPTTDGVICRGFNQVVNDNHFEDNQHSIHVQANATYCNVNASGNHSMAATIPVKITGIDDDDVTHRPCSVNINGMSMEVGPLGANRTVNVGISDMQVGHFRIAEHGSVMNYSRKRLGKSSAGTGFYCKGNVTPVNQANYQPPNLSTHSKTGILPAAINTTRHSITINDNTLRQNDRVQLEVTYVTGDGGKLPDGWSAFQAYFVNLIETNEITLSEYPNGPVVEISDAGKGEFSITLLGGNYCKIKDTYADRKALTGATTTTDQINIDDHMFWHDMPVHVVKGTDALPTGLSEGVQYYVLEVDDDEFSLSLTPGGAAVSITVSTGSTTTIIEPSGYIIIDPAWDMALIDDKADTNAVNLAEIYWNETELLPAGISHLEGKELRVRALSVLRDVNLIHGLGQAASNYQHGVRTSNSRDITLADNDQVITLVQNSAKRWITPDSQIKVITAGDYTAIAPESGALTVTSSCHTITPEGGVGSGADAVTSIVGGNTGQIVVLSPTTTGASDAITITDGGNIHCAGNFTMDHVDDTITLIYTGEFWQEIARSTNA